VEQILFKLSHPSQDAAAWAVDPMLFKEKLEELVFDGQDWDKVPKVAYETALFRKMAPPRMAKVVTNPGAFVIETYGAPVPISVPKQVARSNRQRDAQSTLEAGDAESKTGAQTGAQTEVIAQQNQPTDLLEEHPSQTQAQTTALHEADPNADEEGASLGALESSHVQEAKDLASTAQQVLDRDDKADDKLIDQKLSDEAPQASLPNLDVTKDALASKSYEEGFQAGLLKGLEQAQVQAFEDAETQRIENTQLKEQINALEQHGASLETHAAELQAKMDEMVQSLATQRESLESEREQLQTQNAQSLQSQVKTLEDVTSKLDDFVNHPQRLFEPLKRLSVHIAEQLVLAELNLSGASIERLIQRCLDELSSHSNQSITIELNAQDKARLLEHSGEMFNNIQLHAVSSMQPGSVRVITDDTQVDDLIGHRLEALANNLLAQPEHWREQSPFFKQPLAQRDTDIQDVRQRLSPIVEMQEEDQND